jgi:hypothetical protein
MLCSVICGDFLDWTRFIRRAVLHGVTSLVTIFGECIKYKSTFDFGILAVVKSCRSQNMKIQMAVPQLTGRKCAMDLRTKQRVKVCVPESFDNADCGKKCWRSAARAGRVGAVVLVEHMVYRSSNWDCHAA